MATQLVVFVADQDDPRRGEVTVLEDPRKAEHLLETLLEAGFEQERIRIFHAAELEMQVKHRPVVSLVADAARESAASTEAAEESRVPSDAPPAPESEEGQPDAEEGEAADGPFVQNGVRFSSMFRPA